MIIARYAFFCKHLLLVVVYRTWLSIAVLRVVLLGFRLSVVREGPLQSCHRSLHAVNRLKETRKSSEIYDLRGASP